MRWQKVACVLLMAFALAHVGCGGKSGTPAPGAPTPGAPTPGAPTPDAEKKDVATPAKAEVKKPEPEKKGIPGAPAEGGEVSKRDVLKKETGEAADAAKGVLQEEKNKALQNLESRRASFQERVDKQFDFLSRRLDTVKEELAKKGTELEEKAKQDLAAAEEKKQVAAQRLDAFKQSSEQTWAELRRDLMRAYADFKRSIDELSGEKPAGNPPMAHELAAQKKREAAAAAAAQAQAGASPPESAPASEGAPSAEGGASTAAPEAPAPVQPK